MSLNQNLIEKSNQNEIKALIAQKIDALQIKLNALENIDGPNDPEADDLKNDSESLLKDIKDLANSFQNKGVGNKNFKKQLQEQIDKVVNRYERIMKDLIQKSFQEKQAHLQESTQYQSSNHSKNQYQQLQQQQYEDDQEMQKNAQLEEELLREKQEQINQLEKKMITIHNIMADTNEIVAESGDNLIQINNNLNKAHTDVKDTNKVMAISNEEQKSNARKTYCIVGLIVVAVIATLMIIIFSV